MKKKKNHVLYVEDEAFQAKLFGKIISDEIKGSGGKLVTIGSGLDALKFLSGKKDIIEVELDKIGLILLDLSMYDISGFEMLKEMEKLKIEIPVAILTAREEDKTKKEAKKLGAVDYFIKGKDLEELERLRKFIINSLGL